MKTSNTAARCELSNHSDCLTFWRSSHMRFAFQGPEEGSSAKARWGTHFDTQPKMAYCDITSQGVSVKLISNKGWNAAADEVLECQVDLSRSALRLIVNDDVLRWLKLALMMDPPLLDLPLRNSVLWVTKTQLSWGHDLKNISKYIYNSQTKNRNRS